MIQFVLIILTSLTFLVGMLLSYAPNYKRVTESDFMRRGYDYANYRALEEAQLGVRARTLRLNTQNQITNAECLYDDPKRCVRITGTATYNSAGITVSLTPVVTEK